MDIRNFYLAQLGKPAYRLYGPGGQMECRVTEVYNPPYYLVWFESDPNGNELAASYDVHEVLSYNGVPHLHVIGGHKVARSSRTSPWIITEAVDYLGGCPMFPIALNEGDAGEITTNGRWSWKKLNPDGTTAATGAGSWTYDSRYEFAFGRLHWDDAETETHDDTGITVPYHCIHQFDITGWMGFIDRLANRYIVRGA